MMTQGAPTLESAVAGLRSRELLESVAEAHPDPSVRWASLRDGVLLYAPAIDGEGLSEAELAAVALREEGRVRYEEDAERAQKGWLWEVAFFASFHALVMGAAVAWYLAVRPDAEELSRVLRYGAAAVLLSFVWIFIVLARYFLRFVLRRPKLVELESDLFAAHLLRDALACPDPAGALGRVMRLEERLSPPEALHRLAVPGIDERVEWLAESVRTRAKRVRKGGDGAA